MIKMLRWGHFYFVQVSQEDIGMAIVSMLGFDNMAAQSGLSTVDPTFPAGYPHLLKSPVGSADISIMQQIGALCTALSYRSDPDPDFNTMISMVPYLATATNTTALTQQWRLGPPVTDTTLDKTGKWMFGTVVSIPGNINSGGALAVIGDTATPANNKAILGVTLGDGAVSTLAGYAYYVEFVIDWVAKTVAGYVDGVIQQTVAFTGTPICYLGNNNEAGYGPAGVAAPWVAAGNYTYLPLTQYMPGYNHIYFAIDVANDPAPTGRLGPVRVRNVLVSSVDAVGSMSTNATDMVTAANTAIRRGAKPTTSIVDDIAGAKGTYHFATPVLTANEVAIVAAQYELFTFKERDAAANAVFGFSDGSTTTNDYTVIATENVRKDVLCLNKPLAGGDWTPAKLAAITVKIGSVRNN